MSLALAGPAPHAPTASGTALGTFLGCVLAGRGLGPSLCVFLPQVGLLPVPSASPLPTALMPDFVYDAEHCIDYLYCSPSLRLVGAPSRGLLSGERATYDGRGPYGSDPAEGSDHCWLKYTFACGDADPGAEGPAKTRTSRAEEALPSAKRQKAQ